MTLGSLTCLCLFLLFLCCFYRFMAVILEGFPFSAGLCGPMIDVILSPSISQHFRCSSSHILVVHCKIDIWSEKKERVLISTPSRALKRMFRVSLSPTKQLGMSSCINVNVLLAPANFYVKTGRIIIKRVKMQVVHNRKRGQLPS